MKHKLLLGILGIMAIMLIAAGCQTQQPELNNTGNTTGSDNNSNIVNVTIGGESAPINMSEEGNTNSSLQFSDIFNVQKPSQWLIIYNVELTTADGTQTATQRIAMKGFDRYKTEFRTERDGKEYATILMQQGKDYYMCTNTNGWMCIKTQATNETVNSPQTDAEQYKNYTDVKYIGKRTIANIESDCFSLDKPQENMTNEWCYDPKTGLLMYAYWQKDQENGSMTATSVSQIVSENEFDLPAQPVDVGQQ